MNYIWDIKLNSEKIMERLLHYVWKYKLYAASPLYTTDGTNVQVIDPGTPNPNAGPDFFNAKIRLGDTLWAGCIEIHDKASDWFLHGHDKDKTYDSVILHVTRLDDIKIYRSNGKVIPMLILPIPKTVEENIEWLLHREVAIPCQERIREIDPLHLSAWMDALLGERLERKTEQILTLMEQYNHDWNEVFYITLTRNFGLSVNSDAFEWLAKSLPLRYIQKQRGSSSQVEAMLFGQAGMLEQEENGHYYRLLQREYRFLQHKFGLKPLDQSLFKSLRIRPVNFPHLKVAQLAALWMQSDTLFSSILEARSTGEIKQYFRVQPSDYWKTHYNFRHTSSPQEKPIGENILNLLLINTVAPLFLAYSLYNKRSEYGERAIRLLESIPPEKNSIITAFCQAGIHPSNACETQALIQLKREYCEKRKCLYCRIGFQLLKRAK